MENKSIQPNIMTLYEELLQRQMFAWNKEDLYTFEERIVQTSKEEAEILVQGLKSQPYITTDWIIEKIQSKAESWQAGPLLKHTKLWEIQSQKPFFNNY